MNLERFEAIAESVVRDGYAVVPGYLGAERTEALAREALDLLSDEVSHSDRHPPGWNEALGVAEKSSMFDELLFDPLLVATYVYAVGPDVELASAGEVDIKTPNSSSSCCGWHNDFIWMPHVRRPRPFFWLAAYYFLCEIGLETGPLWVLPGSHLWPAEPTAEMDNDRGYGRQLDGSKAVTGPAGTVLLLNNEIWHMSPPNTSSCARLIYKVHVKPTWMKPWGNGRAPSSAYAATKTKLHELQLLGAYEYDEVNWQYGRDLDEARFPVLAWLRTLPWISSSFGSLDSRT